MFPPFFMLPLGFIIFPYLILLLLKNIYVSTLVNLFFKGFCFGFGFLVIYLVWIYNPFRVYESTRPFAIIAILLPIFLSVFFGLCFLIYKYFKKPIHVILITPFIFTLNEFLISNFLYGFPWISNSLMLSNNILGFYLIKYSGTLTSGYLIILIFLLPALLLKKIK